MKIRHNKVGKKKQNSFDYILGPIFSFLCLIKKIKKREIVKKPKKIMILKLTAIGDALMSLPFIKATKEKYKDSEVIVVCSKENEKIFKEQHFIDKIIVVDINDFNILNLIKILFKLKKESPEIIIDTSQVSYFPAIISLLVSRNFSIGLRNYKRHLRNSLYDKLADPNPKIHMLVTYFDLISYLGIKRTRQNIKMIPPKYSSKNEKKVEKILSNRKNKLLIGIHTSNILNYREWIPQRYFLLINHLIKKYDANIVLIGDLKEEEKVNKIYKKLDKKMRKKVINLSGKLELKDLFVLLKKVNIFIANDGAPMHIAASMNTPVLGLFGSDTPFRYAPFNNKSLSIFKEGAFNPCNKPYLCQYPNVEGHECLKEIKVEEVLEAVDLILKKLWRKK